MRWEDAEDAGKCKSSMFIVFSLTFHWFLMAYLWFLFTVHWLLLSFDYYYDVVVVVVMIFIVFSSILHSWRTFDFLLTCHRFLLSFDRCSVSSHYSFIEFCWRPFDFDSHFINSYCLLIDCNRLFIDFSLIFIGVPLTCIAFSLIFHYALIAVYCLM